jgi:hypothetical protein
MASIPHMSPAFREDWWDRDPAWRDLAYACTSKQERCQLCHGKPRSLQAIPKVRDNPYGDLVAVCGQCKIAARKYHVAPESKPASKHTLGPLMAHQITNTNWRIK